MPSTEQDPAAHDSNGGATGLETLVDEVVRRLEAAGVAFGQGVDNALDEAAWIVLRTLERSPYGPHSHTRVSAGERQKVLAVVEQRIAARMPYAYLVNEAWFAGLPFYVDPRVLIPRSYFAEWIPERFEPWIDSSRVTRILDLCTGSGCIAVACALAFPDARVVASDISEQALEVARINIARHGLESRVETVCSDGLADIQGPFDLVVCNPPYVSQARMQGLPPEFRQEPRLALEAADDGLSFILRLLSEAPRVLSDTGALLVESGSASPALEARCPGVPFSWLGTAYDETVIFLMGKHELLHHGVTFVDAQPS